MCLDKVFIKHPNICIVSKKDLVCVFPKNDRKMLLKELYHIAN